MHFERDLAHSIDIIGLDKFWCFEQPQQPVNAVAAPGTKRAKLEREAASNEREAVARRDARDFARYAKGLTGKLLTMHERLKTSHFRSIENPRGPSRRPVAVLLNASNSEYVRGKHGLSVEAFQCVFKIVEGQEGLHVRKELWKLGQKNCEVFEVPVYFANGIALLRRVRKGLN